MKDATISELYDLTQTIAASVLLSAEMPSSARALSLVTPLS